MVRTRLDFSARRIGDPFMTTHLVLVDDDDLLRRSLAFNLERAGYRVETVASAEDTAARV